MIDRYRNQVLSIFCSNATLPKILKKNLGRLEGDLRKEMR